MAGTPLLSIPEIQENQAGKYVTHNEALAIIEGLITRVLSRNNGGPPSSPADGDTYIVDNNSGSWSDASVGDIAHYYSGYWHFITPVEGLSIWCIDDGANVQYDGVGWGIDYASRINFNIPLSNQDAVGIVDRFTVAFNSYGFAAAMRFNTSGELEEASAFNEDKMPCSVLALYTGTGSEKQVLFWGRIRNDNWNWDAGKHIYVDTSSGALTQVMPNDDNNVVQIAGIATHSNQIIFNPSYSNVVISK